MPVQTIKIAKISFTFGFFISIFIHAILAFLIFYVHNSVKNIVTPQENLTKISLDSFSPPVAAAEPEPEPEEKQEVTEEKIIEEKVVEDKIVEKVVEEKKSEKKKKLKKIKKKQEAVFAKNKQDLKDGLTDTPKPSSSASYANIASQIAAIITREVKKNYPENARKRRQTGVVQVSFLYDINSVVKDIKIVKSSGFEILDNHVLKVINKVKHKFPKPDTSATYVVPVKYTLI